MLEVKISKLEQEVEDLLPENVKLVREFFLWLQRREEKCR